MGISFGTEGWRGVIAEEFTFENVRKFSRGVANWLYWPKRGELEVYREGGSRCLPPSSGVAVSYDTRFMSDRFAAVAASELAACGIPVFLSSSFLTSPSLCDYVVRRGLSAGIMITASHNSPEYNGIKFKAEYGGSAVPGIICGIERMIGSGLSCIPEGVRAAGISKFSNSSDFASSIASMVDMERIANSRFKVIIDPIYGSASGVLDRIFRSAGLFADEIRSERNPLFGGYSPVPSVNNIAPLTEKVLKTGASVGIAFDGDGDTVGIVDSYGGFLQSYDVFAIVLRHLVENRGMRGGVAAAFSTSGIIRRMAERYGLPFHETPVGFRHITDLMLRDDILIGGEESGGIGVKGSIPDKNGPLAALLVLEAMAVSGKSLYELKDEIISEFGELCLHRTDIKFTSNEEKEVVIENLHRALPKSFCGLRISEMAALDGIKCFLEDGSWILFRPSGTEPLFRIYAESDGHKKAYALLNECESFIKKIL